MVSAYHRYQYKPRSCRRQHHHHRIVASQEPCILESGCFASFWADGLGHTGDGLLSQWSQSLIAVTVTVKECPFFASLLPLQPTSCHTSSFHIIPPPTKYNFNTSEICPAVLVDYCRQNLRPDKQSRSDEQSHLDQRPRSYQRPRPTQQPLQD